MGGGWALNGESGRRRRDKKNANGQSGTTEPMNSRGKQKPVFCQKTCILIRPSVCLGKPPPRPAPVTPPPRARAPREWNTKKTDLGLNNKTLLKLPQVYKFHIFSRKENKKQFGGGLGGGTPPLITTCIHNQLTWHDGHFK